MFLLLLAAPLVLAANDPGHDTLYVLRIGNTNVSGSINLTGNITATLVQATSRFFGPNLDLRGDGTSSTAQNYLVATTTDLKISSGTSIILNEGTGKPVQVGSVSTPSNLNVTGSIYQGNVKVCLQNGSNCPLTLGGSNVSGSGSIGYLAKWTSSGVIGNSVIYDDGTNVGIGTVSFAGKLTVATTNNSVGIAVSTPSGTISDSAFIAVNSRSRFGYNGTREAVIIDDGGATKHIVFDNAGAERMRIASSGNVGINDSTPSATLDVGGSIATSGTVRISSTGVGTLTAGTTINSQNVCLADGTNCPAVTGDNTSWTEARANTLYYPLTTNPRGYYNSSTIPSYATSAALTAEAAQRVGNDSLLYLKSNPFGFYNSSTIPAYLTSVPYQTSAAGWTNTTGIIYTTTISNDVGIGTTSPLSKLDVNGTIFAASGLTDNLVPDPQFSEGTRYWTTGCTAQSAVLDNGDIVNACDATTTTNAQITSDYVPVNPYKTYRFSIWMRSNSTLGTRYLGMHAYNSAKSQLFTYNSAGTGTTNYYFWSGDITDDKWEKKTGYLLACNTPNSWANPADSSSSNYRMDCNTSFVRMRFLNYYNYGNMTNNTFALPKIEEVQDSLEPFYHEESDYIIYPAGNVGIGTKTPAQKLDVNGNLAIAGTTRISSTGVGTFASGTTVNSQNICTADGTNCPAAGTSSTAAGWTNTSTTIYTTDITDNVGIGTTTPGARLEVKDNGLGTATVAFIRQDDDNTYGLVVNNAAWSGTVTNGLRQYVKLTGTYAAIDHYESGGAILSLNPSGGNVGIGTTAPHSKLHVVGQNITLTSSVASGLIDFNIFDASTNAAGFRIRYDDSTGTTYLDNLYDAATGDIYIRTKAAGTPVDAIFIESAGNVGIGTTNPGALLHVNGSSSQWMIVERGAKQMYVNANYGGSNAYGQIGMRSADSMGLSLAASDTRPQDIFITSAGRVGVGTTNPVAVETYSRLTVNGSDGTAHQMTLINEGAGQAGFTISRTGTTPSRWYQYIPAGSTDLRFHNTADRVTFTAAGGVTATTFTGALSGNAATASDINGLATTGLVKRTGANTFTTITDSSTNWDTAHTDRLKWDGGSTGLVVATGRTSLGLGTADSPTFAAVTATTFTGALSGNAATATAAGLLTHTDNRIISPSEQSANRMGFGFTSWNNDNGAPYADFLHLRSYGDASGGNDNLVLFRKDAIGMRIYQQTFGSASAYATYKDVVFGGDSPTFAAVTATTFTGALSGNAGTASALAADPVDCSAGQAPRGINAAGTAVSCTTYLTGEADTLATVTGRGATTSTAVTFSNTGTAVKIGGGATPAIGHLVVSNAAGTYISANYDAATDITTFMGADSSDYGMVGTYTNHDFVIRSNNVERARFTTAGAATFGDDFTISTTDSTSSPGTPWIRSNGAYLVINPDTGSNLYLSWDTGAITYVGSQLRVGTGTPTQVGTTAGTLYVTGAIETDGAFYGSGVDLAENIKASEADIIPGTVVELDPNNPDSVKRSTGAYSKLVAGIVSTDPGIVLGKDKGGNQSIELAVSGRVPVSANTENGPIAVGDLLTTSSTPGEAMRCDDQVKCFGAILGKAMEPLNTGSGSITALVVLG
jgi:hypothetical protein